MRSYHQTAAVQVVLANGNHVAVDMLRFSGPRSVLGTARSGFRPGTPALGFSRKPTWRHTLAALMRELTCGWSKLCPSAAGIRS